jgi:AraC-like DNA-binding protein
MTELPALSDFAHGLKGVRNRPRSEGQGSTLIADRLHGMQASREVIPFNPQHSFRWHTHDYPSPSARWNYHPELEIHLIRSGEGRFIVGDRIGSFGPGHIALIGTNLPHDWVGDLGPGEVIEGRDVVLQFDGRWIEQCMILMPELTELDSLLQQSSRGIQFFGRTATIAAEIMENVGTSVGTDRISQFFKLLALLAQSPPSERELLAAAWFSPAPDRPSMAVVDIALQYIFSNQRSEVRMSEAAALSGLSETAFSRHFKKWTGLGFSEMVRKLRLARARHLLEQTDDPVAVICYEVGFTNLSNFNRRFLSEMQETPTQYRRRAASRQKSIS